MAKRLQKLTGVAVLVAVASVVFAVSNASAFALRLPQVPFNNFPQLQGYLNVVDSGINVLTDQLDAQVFSVAVTGNTDFTLTLENGLGTTSNVGVYSGNDPNPSPTLYQIFPAAAIAGWYAALHFSATTLTVTLIDQNNVIQGQTVYNPGPNRNDFGFYIQGVGGTWYSQDFRNISAGQPQVLTYQSNLTLGDYWECFDELPYDVHHSTFASVVLSLQSVRPTPVRSTTWGKLKAEYR
jgi:hypothetical protein